MRRVAKGDSATLRAVARVYSGHASKRVRPLEFLSTHPSPANCRVSLAALVPEMRKLKPTTLRKPLPVEILH